MRLQTRGFRSWLQLRHTAGMHRSHRRWFWLVLIAFLATRLVDVHLHLCFDGQEPASAVHMADGAVHDDADHVDKDHADRDVDMFDAILLKKLADPSDALMALFVATLLLGLLPARAHRVPLGTDPPIVLRSLLLLRPPLRGPPL
jgi:hypothetical protein